MVKYFRDLTTKYRWLRRKPDPLYSSRTIRNIFNKFIRRGKRSRAYCYLYNACFAVRCTVREPRIFNILIDVTNVLQAPLVLTSARKGSVIIMVPVPVFRNKGEVRSIQTFYKSVPKFEYKRRRKRNYPFYKQIKDEVVQQTVNKSSSLVLRERDKTFSVIFEERANEMYR